MNIGQKVIVRKYRGEERPEQVGYVERFGMPDNMGKGHGETVTVRYAPNTPTEGDSFRQFYVGMAEIEMVD